MILSSEAPGTHTTEMTRSECAAVLRTFLALCAIGCHLLCRPGLVIAEATAGNSSSSPPNSNQNSNPTNTSPATGTPNQSASSSDRSSKDAKSGSDAAATEKDIEDETIHQFGLKVMPKQNEKDPEKAPYDCNVLTITWKNSSQLNNFGLYRDDHLLNANLMTTKEFTNSSLSGSMPIKFTIARKDDPNRYADKATFNPTKFCPQLAGAGGGGGGGGGGSASSGGGAGGDKGANQGKGVKKGSVKSPKSGGGKGGGAGGIGDAGKGAKGKAADLAKGLKRNTELGTDVAAGSANSTGALAPSGGKAAATASQNTSSSSSKPPSASKQASKDIGPPTASGAGGGKAASQPAKPAAAAPIASKTKSGSPKSNDLPYLAKLWQAFVPRNSFSRRTLLPPRPRITRRSSPDPTAPRGHRKRTNQSPLSSTVMPPLRDKVIRRLRICSIRIPPRRMPILPGNPA